MTTQRYPFIVVEGQDGTGKTTLRKGLFQLFRTKYFTTPLCLLTTNYIDFRVTPDLIDGKYRPSADNRAAYLAALQADKVATMRTCIEPSLSERPVIADRWLLSEVVFFAVKHQMDPYDTYRELGAATWSRPDITFVLDLEPTVSLKRSHARAGDATRPDWDVLDVQENVRRIYRKILDHPNRYDQMGKICVIDAAQSRASVLGAVWRTLLDERLVVDERRVVEGEQ